MKLYDLQVQRGSRPTAPGQTLQNRGLDRHRPAEQPEKTRETFSAVVKEKIKTQGSFRFSAHAVRRLQDRSIRLSPTELSRLESGIRNLTAKGGRSSLILLDDTAYIVSINSRTVVTALTREATLNKVFTNIDSVAVV